MFYTWPRAPSLIWVLKPQPKRFKSWLCRFGRSLSHTRPPLKWTQKTSTEVHKRPPPGSVEFSAKFFYHTVWLTQSKHFGKTLASCLYAALDSILALHWAAWPQVPLGLPLGSELSLKNQHNRFVKYTVNHCDPGPVEGATFELKVLL